MHQKSVISDQGLIETFDLNSELSALESRKPWPQGLTSKTLLKSADLRVLLIAMDPGAKMKEHHADGRISIHLLRGRIRMHVQERVSESSAHQLLILDRSIRHDVEALEPSAFLLTIAWPSDEELRGLKHRGYGS